MKARRFQTAFRQSASKGHRLVGELLRSGPLSNCKIYQEYPVWRVNPSVKNTRLKYDWVLLDLKVVVEVMGEQHQHPVNFGGIDDEEVIANFHAIRERDALKEQAAKEVGFGYIAIWYNELSSLTSDRLVSLCLKAATQIPSSSCQVTSKRTAFKEQQREQARKYRKEQYNRAKEWKKQHSLKSKEGD